MMHGPINIRVNSCGWGWRLMTSFVNQVMNLQVPERQEVSRPHKQLLTSHDRLYNIQPGNETYQEIEIGVDVLYVWAMAAVRLMAAD